MSKGRRMNEAETESVLPIIDKIPVFLDYYSITFDEIEIVRYDAIITMLGR